MGIALRVLLGFIGTLTLAIGGVGLANIMLVSVTQRTREIGMLKSIGATRRAILAQFLLEAVAIVTVGGLIGVAAGWAVTAILEACHCWDRCPPNQRGGRHPPAVSTFAVITSTAMLETIGLDRRIAARHQGARLDPIEALRYE